MNTERYAYIRPIRVKRETFRIHSEMAIGWGDWHNRVVDRRGTERLCLTHSQGVQAGRLLGFSFRIQQGIPIRELERLQPVREIEIICVIIGRQHEVDLVLPCLIVDRSVAVGESVSEARRKTIYWNFYILKPLSGWATIVPVNEPFEGWANDPLLSAIALPIPPSVSPSPL